MIATDLIEKLASGCNSVFEPGQQKQVSAVKHIQLGIRNQPMRDSGVDDRNYRIIVTRHNESRAGDPASCF
jgi:hypothetical protein